MNGKEEDWVVHRVLEDIKRLEETAKGVCLYKTTTECLSRGRSSLSEETRASQTTS